MAADHQRDQPHSWTIISQGVEMFFRKRRPDEDFRREIEAHIATETQRLIDEGMTPQDARTEAHRRFGNVTASRERFYESRRIIWWDHLRQDLKYAVRSMRKRPVFVVVVILTLALGIGANTAIFSIVNGVILRRLPYPKPEQLMYFNTQIPSLGLLRFPVSLPEYFEFREWNRSFADVGAYTMDEVNMSSGDRPLRVRAATVDGNLLSALGVQAEQGRLFLRGETDVTGSWNPGDPANMPPPAVVILSHELWQSAFGGRSIVGETIEVDGKRSKVLGIMPAGADLMDKHIEIWLPLGLNPANRKFRGYHILQLVGRLKEGVTAQAAQKELDGLIENWAERSGVAPGGGAFVPLSKPGAHILQMRPMQAAILGDVTRSIWVLQATVTFVLLIACANLANLFLARAETRHREFALRAALGADLGRLLVQFMTETVLLSLAGGALGLWFAWAGVQALLRAYPTSLPRMGEVTVDLSVLLFTLGVSLSTGILFGLVPFAHMRMRAIAATLTEGARSSAGKVRHRIRGALVIAEVALEVMLVIGAGLLVRTAYNLTNVDAGFDRSRLVTFSITTPYLQYTHLARGQLYARILDALRAVHGVQSVTASSGLPPARSHDGEDTRIENYTNPSGTPFANVDHYQSVMSDYFETMGIAIVQGRGFQPADAASSGMVAVVNETLANTIWKGQDPIGRRLRPGWGDWVPWFTVIGVAKDVKQSGVDQKTESEFYFFVDQMARAKDPVGRTPPTINVVLRTTLQPAALSKTVESLVREQDATIPVVHFREMEDVFAESIRRPRFLAELVGGFAGVALLLAAIGTYGVLTYMVAGHSREIGIRMALGATSSAVLAAVMKQGLWLTISGVAIGLAGALALSRLIATLLFGVQPTDITTIVTSTAVITVVAACACWLPARRASRLDPNMMLRDE
jgi:predicted permease